MIGYGFQCAGNLILAQINVYHYREAQCDCAGTCGNNHFVQCAESIYECGNSFLGIRKQSRKVARSYAAEDQCCTDCNGYNVDHGSHVMSQGDDTKLQTHLYAGFCTLLDDISNQKCQNTLALIILYYRCNSFRILSLTQNNCYAGDITGYQRNAQGTDDGVGHEADAAFICIRSITLSIF